MYMHILAHFTISLQAKSTVVPLMETIHIRDPYCDTHSAHSDVYSAGLTALRQYSELIPNRNVVLATKSQHLHPWVYGEKWRDRCHKSIFDYCKLRQVSDSTNSTTWIYSKGNTRISAGTGMWCWKMVLGVYKTRNISETAEDRAKVTINCIKIHEVLWCQNEWPWWPLSEI